MAISSTCPPFGNVPIAAGDYNNPLLDGGRNPRERFQQGKDKTEERHTRKGASFPRCLIKSSVIIIHFCFPTPPLQKRQISHRFTT